MATNLTEWIPKVAPAVRLCPDPAIKTAVLDICRDFCQRTLLWDENALTAIDIVDGTHTYALSSTSGDIVAVDYVQIEDVPLNPVSVNELNYRNVRWRDKVATRSGEYIVGMADEIRLVYEPDEDITGGLEVWACLKPLETATTVQDFLWRDYWRAIADGAKGQLLEIPGMPWTNEKLGAYLTQRYEDARDSAASKKFTGRTRYEQRASTAAAFFA